MQLTPHFSRAEFERSELAARNGFDNTVPDVLLPNLQRTAELLEDVRRHVGAIRISSGYRSGAVNALAGGATKSAHMEARAADINVDGMTPMTLAIAIRDAGVVFDKLILEFGAWVHIQVARSGESPRGELLTAKHITGMTVYLPGLEA